MDEKKGVETESDSINQSIKKYNRLMKIARIRGVNVRRQIGRD